MELPDSLDSPPGTDVPGDTAVLYRAPGRRYPVAVAGSGMHIQDAAGNSYLDMSGGAAVSCLGHGNAHVIDAICAQLESLPFAHTAFFTNYPQERLAAGLASHFQEPGASVYFVSGGSEANEAALKLAWQYWAAKGKPDKKIIISREHSYHGNTFGALSVSGNPTRRRASAAPLVDWPRIAPCYEYRERSANESADDYAARSASELERAILSFGADKIAAFICEPVVGSSLGVVPAVPGYLRRIREICDRHEVLLILDEVMSGCGRTGRYYAHEYDSVVPDLVTLAKGIAAGYMPLGAVVMRSDVAECLRAAGFVHGHTYIGHATACAAGLAVLEIIQQDDLLERTLAMGHRFRQALTEAFQNHPNVGDVRGRGLFAGIELVADRETRAGFASGAALADELRDAAMRRGLICYPGSITIDGATVPHVMLAPPMIVEDQHIEACVGILAQVFDDVLSPTLRKRAV